MKIIFKVLMTILIILCISVIIPNNTTFAQDAMGILGNVNPDMKDNSGAGTAMTEVVNKLLGFLQIASALLAVVMIAVTGFRYIMETPEMKNELKKSMIPIIVGIILVFFAASIAKFFIGMFNNNDPNAAARAETDARTQKEIIEMQQDDSP